MKNQILFFDIDGTLAIHRHIPDHNLKALAALKKLGYLTFICTGRNPQYAAHMFHDLVSGYITCNGRYVLYQGKKLTSEPLTPAQLAYFKKQMNTYDCGALFISDTQSYPYHIQNEQVEKLRKEYGDAAITLDSSDLTFYNFDLFYRNISHRDQLMQVFHHNLIINDHGGIGHADCSIKGFDKGNAISYLLNYFHLEKKNAYAFGDGMNDQAMFREVEHRVAMGNAVDVLKQQATYITAAVDQDGIRKALLHEGLLQEVDF